MLDKTGTVTTGVMEVTAVLPGPERSRETLLGRACVVENASEHAVAAAISAAARAEWARCPR